MAVSVIDNKGSAIPEMMAGTAKLLILRKDIFGVFVKKNFGSVSKLMFTRTKIKQLNVNLLCGI